MWVGGTTTHHDQVADRRTEMGSPPKPTLTVVLDLDDRYSHRSYDAPFTWSPGDVHRVLRSRGFKPFTPNIDVGLSAVTITLLSVPPVTLLRTAADEIGYVSGVPGGPQQYYLPESDKDETQNALLEVGSQFDYEGRMVSDETKG